MVVFFQQADVFIFVGEYLHQYGLIDRIRIGEHFHGFFQFCRVVYALVEESPFGSQPWAEVLCVAVTKRCVFPDIDKPGSAWKISPPPLFSKIGRASCRERV